ncbi:hypothetical protein [Rheinheimera aquimaris]|uniref:Uncharacterized protein n=1 Tax=Rheinheimera aquimaris TaxID=412437 RepID=A0ABP3NZI5_9GAMM|nr:hypothetical protein [Rheinheimera aquimaris]MCB5214892.1 hypothetical protein [Rheinheimera aquimaris]
MKAYRVSLWFPLVALLLAATHLTIEYVSGGVQSHHLLNDATLPAISNWFELVTLPLLGLALAKYAQLQPAHIVRLATVPVSLLPGLIGAVCYGAVFAASFALGQMTLTTVLFFGLLPCAVLFPLYRLHYISGFTVAMTFTFGGILPLVIAAALALVSWCSRFIIARVVTGWRKYRASPAQPL